MTRLPGERRRQAYTEGQAARRARRRKTSCPYPLGREASYWLAGWNDTDIAETRRRCKPADMDLSTGVKE